MSQKAADFLSFVKNNKAEWVELRFCDAGGKEQHVSFPAAIVDEEFATSGRMFDGSSIAGWKSIDDSDMQLIPDPTAAIVLICQNGTRSKAASKELQTKGYLKVYTLSGGIANWQQEQLPLIS